MKKILFSFLLVTVIMLSGCIPFMPGFYNAVPNSEISESLISRMKNNTGTHSIEGFTAESTFGDVLNRITPAKISQAHLAYKTEFLGYPAVMECVFGNYRGKLLIDFMAFTAYRNGGGRGYESDFEELTAKMDAEFGSHDNNKDFDFDDYIWKVNNWSIDMLPYKESYAESGKIACITISPDVVLFGILPGTPEICPYKFGTDIETVFRNEVPAALPDDFNDKVYLEYTDDGIEIDLRFETDETGVRLCDGSYDMQLNDMGFADSLVYFESLANGLEAAVGTPLSRGYGIPDVETDFTGITGITHGTEPGGQGMSAEDILKSGEKYYFLDMNWLGINFGADYCMGVDMSLDFSEEYFTAK